MQICFSVRKLDAGAAGRMPMTRGFVPSDLEHDMKPWKVYTIQSRTFECPIPGLGYLGIKLILIEFDPSDVNP